MEDDLVKQYKNKAKRIKSGEKQQHAPEDAKDTVSKVLCKYTVFSK